MIRSDLVRKELAGAAGQGQNSSTFGEGIYTAEWTGRTYAECLRQVEERLFEGERVVVDANFREEGWRQAFLEAATRRSVPGVFMLCQAGPTIIGVRLANRRDDASHAEWPIYLKAAAAWEEPGPATRPVLQTIATGGTVEEALGQAVEALRQRGLHG